jgi:hypothetical protein
VWAAASVSEELEVCTLMHLDSLAAQSNWAIDQNLFEIDGEGCIAESSNGTGH